MEAQAEASWADVAAALVVPATLLLAWWLTRPPRGGGGRRWVVMDAEGRELVTGPRERPPFIQPEVGRA